MSSGAVEQCRAAVFTLPRSEAGGRGRGLRGLLRRERGLLGLDPRHGGQPGPARRLRALLRGGAQGPLPALRQWPGVPPRPRP